jgi:predicted HD phosphohydrolase
MSPAAGKRRDANIPFYAATADRVLSYFDHMLHETIGTAVDTRTHSLQTASRALRDGANEETVVAALLHDIGESLSPHNHSEIAAPILRPYVTASTAWVLLHHGIF